MFHFAFPSQSLYILVSVLKNEEQFCITGYSVLNQRMSKRKLILNCNYSRMIPCVLLGDFGITKWYPMCTSAAMINPTVIWGYNIVSSLWGCCTVFLHQKFLHAYKGRNSQKVLLRGHKISLYWPHSSSVLDALNFWEVCCDSVGAAPLWCFS